MNVYWGDLLYDTAICERHDKITVGADIDNTFVVPLKSDTGTLRSFKLIELESKNKAILQFNDIIKGHVTLGEEFLSLTAAKKSKNLTPNNEGFYSLELSTKDKAELVIGHLSFSLTWLEKEIPVVDRNKIEKKNLFWWSLIAVGIIFTTYLLANIELPEPEKPPERLVTIIPKDAPAKAAMGERKTEDGGAQKGPEGKAAFKAEEKPSAAEQLRKSNLGSMLSGLTSLGKNAPAPSNEGTQSAVQQESTGGFTTKGLGKGAGGNSVGIGRTVGRGEGGFEGTGRLGLSGNAAIEGGTGHGSGATITEGGLDREVIESIIRKRQDRIRLCYERQLNFNSALAGKIAVHFVIGKKGNVISADIIEDTMKNASVKNCLINEVKTWNFPAPQGGTIVNVDYPFIFESSARK